MAELAINLRNQLNDPVRLCGQLGLMDRSKRQVKGLIIQCPVHGEKNPSCSVTIAPSGTIRCKCFACGWGGDALSLIASAHGLLTTGDDFTEVLALSAEYSGDLAVAQEIRAGVPDAKRKPLKQQPVVSSKKYREPEYPKKEAVAQLWEESSPISRDMDAVSLLLRRGIDPGLVEDLDLARVISTGQRLPWWAKYRGDNPEPIPWSRSYRMILPSLDCHGEMRSVRAWRLDDSSGPKRLPPSGCRGAKLLQANSAAKKMLKSCQTATRVWVVEGEPDYLLTATVIDKDSVVLGIGCGSWSEDFAAKISCKSQVLVATHSDRAGDKYAEAVIESLGNRVECRRWGIGG